MQSSFIFYYVIPLLIILGGIFCYIWLKKPKYLTIFLIFIFFLLIYSAGNLSNIDRHSPFNHYSYLADAMLHGRSYLTSNPINLDVANYKGKIYICHNPLPAIIMLPFIFIYGIDFNDILFNIIFGCLNSCIVFSIVLRLNTYLKDYKFSGKFALFITLLFGLGSVHWYVAVRGTSWYIAHIITLFFLLLAVHEAVGQRRYWLMGIFAGLAVIARPSVFWAFPFFVVLGVYDFLLKKKVKEFFMQMLAYVLPYVVLGILLGLWNYIRFGNPLDFGFDYLNHAPGLKEEYEKYGTVNLFFLPRNLYIAFASGYRRIRMFPFLVSEPHGMAIEFTSPFFLYLLTPVIFWLKKLFTKQDEKIDYNQAIVIGCVLAAVCTAIPLFLYFNTGWVQFGYRYLLDYIPFLLIPLAFCMRGKITWLGIVFFIIALTINFAGMIIYVHNELNIAFAPLYS